MIDLKFQLRTLPSGGAVLEFGIAFRLLFGGLAIVLGGGVATGDTRTIVPIVILIILMLGALYQERWEVLPSSATVISKQGLLVLSRKRRWRFDQIAAIEYTYYRAGSIPGSTQQPPGDTGAVDEAMNRFGYLGRGLKRHFLRYDVLLTDGRRIRIELRRIRDWEADKKIPATVAGIVGVPLEYVQL